MAPNTLPSRRKCILYYALIAYLSILSTMALEVYPSNDTLPEQPFPQYLSSVNPESMGTIVVVPLTFEVGLDQNGVAVNMIKIKGTVTKATAASVGSITDGDIALVNCDGIPGNPSPISDIVEDITTKKPQAVVLYTYNSNHCEVKDTGPYTTFYSAGQINVESAKFAPTRYEAEISTKPVDQSNSQPPPTPKTSETDIHRSATPAVAMSILYAVTGIVTVLFLVIIATGAWRAHTNPERYGPRAGFAGRPRQSRAKGLARAMLETLPIVKFGDPVPRKGASEDVEMHDTSPNDPRPSDGANDSHSKEGPRSGAVEATVTETNSTTESHAAKPQEQSVSVTESNTGCSICTEDFNKGEDVRVLPCNHQYHPACIDPWLLNVSGTCPLCRVDLRPVPEDINEQSNMDNPTSPRTAAGETDHTSHHRVHRIMALRHATVHERMATLRQLAREAGNEQQSQDAASSEEAIQRRRLADRLRSAFRVRTRRTDASEVNHPVSRTVTSSRETDAAENPARGSS